MVDSRRHGMGMTVMALFRAMESNRPEGERLFYDPISGQLVKGLWQMFLLPGLGQALVTFAKRRAPGFLGCLFCRTRYIDDRL